MGFLFVDNQFVAEGCRVSQQAPSSLIFAGGSPRGIQLKDSL